MIKNPNRPKTARELREHYRDAFRDFDTEELRTLLLENRAKLLSGDISVKESEAMNKAARDLINEMRARLSGAGKID